MKPGTLFVMGMIALAGCAGASVAQHSEQMPASNQHPTQIAVYPFAVDPDEVELSRGFIQRAYRVVTASNEDEKQAEIADDISHSICIQTAKDLMEKGYNAVCLKRGFRPSATTSLSSMGNSTTSPRATA